MSAIEYLLLIQLPQPLSRNKKARHDDWLAGSLLAQYAMNTLYSDQRPAARQGERVANLVEVKYIGVVENRIVIIQQGAPLFG